MDIASGTPTAAQQLQTQGAPSRDSSRLQGAGAALEPARAESDATGDGQVSDSNMRVDTISITNEKLEQERIYHRLAT
eukprot:1009679-Rhodomonas_salina.1